MSIHIIKMPDLGEGIAEVELVAWHVQPGDSVREDQTLAEVMTDKATVELPSPVAGRVLALGGVVGQVLAVGAELIRIELGAATSSEPAAAAPAAPVAPPAERPTVAAPPPSPRQAAPVPAVPASASNRTVATPAAAPTERPIASPSVRRRAWGLGLDLARIRGSGPGGRIMQADLDGAAAVPAGTVASAPTRPVPAAAGLVPREDETAIPIVGLRRKIALKMQEAKRRIPHFSYVEEVDVGELEALRARLNEQWQGQRPRLTLLPLLMRALVLAVREHPGLNARFDDGTGVLVQHGAVHIGIATQTASGLLVPVVRHAEALDLWASAAELARLAEAARQGRITRDELSGSTITITSLGPLGGIATTPIINHPEVAIVGINRIALRPVIRDGMVVARPLMNLSSSFDHRVVDGLHAAEFVQALRRRLECPGLLFTE
jgi:2-oxoisovalerate dehydrogenase E2 component (dihydrolipoyl transacylase)